MNDLYCRSAPPDGNSPHPGRTGQALALEGCPGLSLQQQYALRDKLSPKCCQLQCRGPAISGLSFKQRWEIKIKLTTRCVGTSLSLVDDRGDRHSGDTSVKRAGLRRSNRLKCLARDGETPAPLLPINPYRYINTSLYMPSYNIQMDTSSTAAVYIKIPIYFTTQGYVCIYLNLRHFLRLCLKFTLAAKKKKLWSGYTEKNISSVEQTHSSLTTTLSRNISPFGSNINRKMVPSMSEERGKTSSPGQHHGFVDVFCTALFRNLMGNANKQVTRIHLHTSSPLNSIGARGQHRWTPG